MSWKGRWCPANAERKLYDGGFPQQELRAFSPRRLDWSLAANGESVQPEELENYRYDNDDTDNIKDVVTHVL
ncbi:MAG TPA: hypothetical protein VFH31_15015 [Pyrinomonadaceae bacterium]|nr:hypothetical protein [Pyrinomonadaceae bacterium]